MVKPVCQGLGAHHQRVCQSGVTYTADWWVDQTVLEDGCSDFGDVGRVFALAKLVGVGVDEVQRDGLQDKGCDGGHSLGGHGYSLSGGWIVD